MKKSLALILFSTFCSMSGYAGQAKLELLAGIEAGIDSDTAMTVSDLLRTQEILSSERTGTVKTWYNVDSTTLYDVKVGKHYTANQRPCIAYTLTTKHNSKTESQQLNACMNHDGQWISIDLNSLSL